VRAATIYNRFDVSFLVFGMPTVLGVKPTMPDYNPQMRAKFLEIWSSGPNPSTSMNMREWCRKAMTEYNMYRHLEIIQAEEEGRDVPPLLEVNFDVVQEWAQKMKDISTMPLRAGAVDAESSELSNQLTSFAATSSPLRQLGLGDTVRSNELSVTVATAATATVFPSPTSAEVQRGLQEMSTRKRSPDEVPKQRRKKKQKKTKVPNAELVQRQKAASLMMGRHEIDADPADRLRRRCQVCFKYKGFCFGDIPHFRSSEFKLDFCPLADDHSIYRTYQANLANRKKDDNEKRYKQSKGEDVN